MNWAFQVRDEDEFVRRVLAGQPEAPKYFAEMKRVNRDEPRVLGAFSRPQRLSFERLEALLAARALIVDTRPASEFGAAHLPHTINIPLDRAFTTWAGSLLPYGADFFLIVEDRCTHCVDEAVRDLAMIGLDRIAGHLGTEVLDQWSAAGRPLARIPQVDATTAAQKQRSGGVTLLDVRSEVEWNAGHVPGAEHIPLGYLPDRLAGLSGSGPVIVYCQGGSRSAIAASLIQARDVSPVLNLTGGFTEWQASGQPVETSQAVAHTT